MKRILALVAFGGMLLLAAGQTTTEPQPQTQPTTSPATPASTQQTPPPIPASPVGPTPEAAPAAAVAPAEASAALSAAAPQQQQPPPPLLPTSESTVHVAHPGQHEVAHVGHDASAHAPHAAHPVTNGGPVFVHAGHAHLTDPMSTIIQHGGHTHTLADAEQHGSLIFGTMVIAMCAAQLALFLWKKYSPTTFDQATVAGLWLFPIGYSLWHGVLLYFRMILLWTIFSVVCGLVMRKALAKPMARTTPRLVYRFFYLLYRLSYATAVSGYAIMMMHFLGFAELFPSLVPSPAFALLLGWYGLYFGVLGRDLASVCSQSMSVSLGYVGRRGEMPLKAVPMNVCAICDGELIASFRPTAGGAPAEAAEVIHKLSCGHQFHESCLRGWTMVGKRDTCAHCNEKVVSRTLKGRMKQPWETTSIAWAWLLDALRYLIVFNPLVLVSAQLVLYIVY